jgi:Domain of unknown function (DUF4706)
MANLNASHVREYFQSLNPIAKRICEDLDSTRESYESAWDYLSREEQHQVINESLIFPDAVLKYHLENEDQPPVQTFPVLKLDFACKLIQDETGAMWKDEHSAPFTWKSQSQLDVSFECHESRSGETPSKEIVKERKKRPAGPPPPPPPKPFMNSVSKTEEATEPANSLPSIGLTEFTAKDTIDEPDQNDERPNELESNNEQVISFYLDTGFLINLFFF